MSSDSSLISFPCLSTIWMSLLSDERVIAPELVDNGEPVEAGLEDLVRVCGMIVGV